MIELVLFGIAWLCLLWWIILCSSARKQLTGLPPGKIIYRGIDEHKARILRAPKYSLSGIPDYVIKQDDEFIPIEIKSSIAPKKLYDSDRMQVVAQALLVEAEFGKRPTRAFVQYPNRTFIIKIESKYVSKLEEAIQLMKRSKATGRIPDVYPSWYLCPTCPRTNCPKRTNKHILSK
jgi:CRISPR-associated protein Cas4